jgi:hypothetical protein
MLRLLAGGLCHCLKLLTLLLMHLFCAMHAATQAVADWLRQQQAEGRLAAAVLMPHHSCAAGVGFAKRVLAAHMPVAFPGLGAGGFQEPVMMRGTGFAKLNLLLELAVARWGREGEGCVG